MFCLVGVIILSTLMCFFLKKVPMKDLIQTLIDFRRERDWEQYHNPKDLSMSIAIEAAELMQEFQWKTSSEVQEHIEKNKDMVADEIADIMTYLLLLATDLDLDMENIIRSKMSKNAKKYPIDKCKSKNTKYTHLR